MGNGNDPPARIPYLEISDEKHDFTKQWPNSYSSIILALITFHTYGLFSCPVRVWVWNAISAKIILLHYKVKCCKGGRFFFCQGAHSRAVIFHLALFLEWLCRYGRRFTCGRRIFQESVFIAIHSLKYRYSNRFSMHVMVNQVWECIAIAVKLARSFTDALMTCREVTQLPHPFQIGIQSLCISQSLILQFINLDIKTITMYRKVYLAIDESQPIDQAAQK